MAPVGADDPEAVGLPDGLAEALKAGLRHVVIEALGLVGDHQHRLATATQQVRHVQVLRRAALPGIDDEQDPVGFLDRLQRLLGHQPLDAADDGLDQAPRVDDQTRAAAVAGIAVLAVAGQAGNVGDERVARTCQGVEKRRLADVRATDQCDDWQHINDPRTRRCGRRRRDRHRRPRRRDHRP